MKDYKSYWDLNQNYKNEDGFKFLSLTSKVRTECWNPGIFSHHIQHFGEDILEMSLADLLQSTVVIRAEAAFSQGTDPVSLHNGVSECLQLPVKSELALTAGQCHSTLTCIFNVSTKVANCLWPQLHSNSFPKVRYKGFTVGSICRVWAVVWKNVVHLDLHSSFWCKDVGEFFLGSVTFLTGPVGSSNTQTGKQNSKSLEFIIIEGVKL